MAKQYGWAYVLASPIVFTLLWRLIRMSEGGKYATDVMLLKIPILGGILWQDLARPALFECSVGRTAFVDRQEQ